MLVEERGVRQMAEAVTATYVQEDADWTITVSGRGKQLTAKAPGIIAARDRADQLVEQLVADDKTTVVHLLNGSALEFTSTYMTARLTLPKLPPLEVPPPGGVAPKAAAAKAAAKSVAPASVTPKGDAPEDTHSGVPTGAVPKQQASDKKPPLPAGKQLPKAVNDRKPAPPARESKTAAKKAATPPAARA
jgi:hypothetical protein